MASGEVAVGSEANPQAGETTYPKMQPGVVMPRSQGFSQVAQEGLPLKNEKEPQRTTTTTVPTSGKSRTSLLEFMAEGSLRNFYNSIMPGNGEA